MAIDSGPSAQSSAVTTSDATQQPVGRALYVGGAGNITGRLLGDNVDTVWNGVAAGSILPLRFQFIRSTGTTATNMLVLF